MSNIDYAIVGIASPTLTNPVVTEGGVPKITVTLSLTSQSSNNYFSMSGNTLTVSAPQNTPVQVSWTPPSSAMTVNGTAVTLAFVGVVIKTGTNISADFPAALVSEPGNLTAGIPSPADNLVLDSTTIAASAALTSVNLNTLQGNKANYDYDYVILFYGSDGNYYLLDPWLDAEHY